jgi:hypothetical protein
MDRYESSYHKAADARMHHVLDTIRDCGPFAPQMLAAEERWREAEQWAAVRSATHTTRERTPGAWRRSLGTLLVRAGIRLQGAVPAATADMTQAIT